MSGNAVRDPYLLTGFGAGVGATGGFLYGRKQNERVVDDWGASLFNRFGAPVMFAFSGGAVAGLLAGAWLWLNGKPL